VPSVLATSVPASVNRLANVLVTGSESIACCVSRRPSAPHGTGDLFAALYLGHLLNGAVPATALAAAASAVEASVAASDGRDELPLAAAGALWANAPTLAVAPV
jgi:pyridoxine kinase